MKPKLNIYCPKCHWEPWSSSHWSCESDCGCRWNTFVTAGKCPRCGKQWEETACLACGAWSRHADWYHEDPPPAHREGEVVTVVE